MATNSDQKNGKLLPFVARAPGQTQARNILAAVYAFNDWQAAKAARIAATPPHLKVKADRRGKQ